GPSAQQGGARLVGLHDPRRRAARRRGPAEGAGHPPPEPPGVHRPLLRDARRLLPRRGARVRRRLAAEHPGQPGRHLRADRADGTAPARRAHRQQPRDPAAR
ncbi:MAG: Glucosamine-6-phosphate deaminase, partial [uncultured Phycisphaerae bacterium]